MPGHRQRERSREREEANSDGTLEDSALLQSDMQVQETALIQGRQMRFLEGFLPDFADMEMTDGIMPVLALQMAHTGDGWIVQGPQGGSGTPNGADDRTTTTTQSPNEDNLTTYTVPQGSTARLVEVSFTGDAGARARINLPDRNTAFLDVELGPSFQFEGAFLDEGEQVIIQIRSEDGTSKEVNGLITVREF